jgi:two-component system, chemotaxis family, response regulator PixG
MNSDTISTYRQLKSLSKTNRLQLLKALHRLDFSGQLVWSSTQGEQWVLLLEGGGILYAGGGIHPRRRRCRYLPSEYMLLGHELNQLTAETSETIGLRSTVLEEYRLLSQWLDQGKFAADKYVRFMHQVIYEVLFDVVQAETVKHELYRVEALASPPSGTIAAAGQSLAIAEDAAVDAAKAQWQAWAEAGLEAYSPALAPVIVRPEALQSAVSPQAYRGLTMLLDGTQSLRDLAVKTKRDILQFSQALKPYLEAGWLELISIPDYPKVEVERGSRQRGTGEAAPLIACIDDSPMICQSVGQVIKSAGYEFVSITEATRAIKMLLTRRPSLIFLDLVMPDTNGYEICSQLRKISIFKETPIIILSGNDGLVDQVRARLLGATDFLSKPMEPVVILSIIQKYLGQMAVV